MALPEQPLPCPERPASGAAAAARPSRHLHPPSRRPPRRKMSQLYRKAEQWLSGLLSDSGITTGAYPVDAY
uniref:Uncharacterized protein n=1 Tax=Oryza nivara TaxID=4536 RepID=A0A0E0G3N2_ORYNI